MVAIAIAIVFNSGTLYTGIGPVMTPLLQDVYSGFFPVTTFFTLQLVETTALCV